MPRNAQQKAVRERVEGYFAQGKPCSQALLLALKDEIGSPPETLLQASTALARGLGGTGSVCSALVAGMMVLGLKADVSNSSSSPPPRNEWLDVYTPPHQEHIFKLCQELALRFSKDAKERFGTVLCRDMSGVDWRDSSPAEVSRYYASDGRVKDCMDTVAQVACDVLELLKAPALA